MKYIISKNANEKIEKRKIPLNLIDEVLNNPERRIDSEGVTIYQSIIDFESKRQLLRVFVNCDKIPFVVVTVYFTNKISKYF